MKKIKDTPLSYNLLAFDIGIKNLAFSITKHQDRTNTITHVDRIDLCCRKNDSQKIIDSVLEVLDNITFNLLDTDIPIIVLIESQMTSIMKAIQTTINVFFKVHKKYHSWNISTIYLSAKHKLNLIDRFKDLYEGHNKLASSQYKQNKIDSIDFGTWLLKSSEYKDENILNHIQSHKKQDDMFDCICMSVYFLEENK